MDRCERHGREGLLQRPLDAKRLPELCSLASLDRREGQSTEKNQEVADNDGLSTLSQHGGQSECNDRSDDGQPPGGPKEYVDAGQFKLSPLLESAGRNTRELGTRQSF